MDRRGARAWRPAGDAERCWPTERSAGELRASRISPDTELFAPIPIERVHALSVGSGVEAAITDRWRLRADYQRYFTDTINVLIPSGGAPLPATVKASAHTARLGASYQLGGP